MIRIIFLLRGFGNKWAVNHLLRGDTAFNTALNGMIVDRPDPLE